eukprot:Rhum_TRINITY_DN6107_c0_g1::Rhum_TRINITY_DN6107_c0_g1_i1::g.19158::m.19158/K02942/RP-LP1, RPLP1; large subunit ribosomal protein LP1
MGSHNEETALMYALLMLKDCGVDVTKESLEKALKAVQMKATPWKVAAFAKFADKMPLDDILSNIGSCAGGAAAPAAAAPAAGEKKEEKKAAAPAAESEEDEDMGFGLFD